MSPISQATKEDLGQENVVWCIMIFDYYSICKQNKGSEGSCKELEDGTVNDEFDLSEQVEVGLSKEHFRIN